jgi:nicotinamidase-related amidase
MNSFTIDPKSTALILIDLQHGVVNMPLFPYSGQNVLDHSSELASAFRGAGALVVYVRVELTELLTVVADVSMRDPNAPPPPAIASQLTPESGYREGDLLITKRQAGAFYGTDLEQQLRRRQIRTIVLGGITTTIGGESTARAASDRGYELIFVEDAMTGLSAEAHNFAVRTIFPFMGRVRKTTTVVESISR